MLLHYIFSKAFSGTDCLIAYFKIFYSCMSGFVLSIISVMPMVLSLNLSGL